MATQHTGGIEAPIDFAGLMGPVVERLLGDPNQRMSRGDRMRWGAKGSLEVDITEGWFCDYEAGSARGGVLDLIQHQLRCDRAGALAWLEEEGLKDRQERREPTGTSTFYDYQDSDGGVLYRVERRKPRTPPFLQHGPDGSGGFHSKPGCMKGVELVPYRLPQLLFSEASEIVFFCEGEKDADRLTGLGLIATTNPGGAGKVPDSFAQHFAGRRVVALEDNDEPGAKHVARVGTVVAPVAAQFATLRVPGPEKSDVSDWLASDGSVAELLRLAEEALGGVLPAGYTRPAPDGSRPAIRVQAGTLHLMATEAETALLEGGAPFYVRGHIVRPIVDEVRAAHGRDTKIARLATVDADMLVDHLSRGVDWVKWAARNKEWVPTDPPRAVASTILSRDGEWRLPRLAGVITTPTLRPDGSILSEPGYDKATRLLLLDPPTLPSIASRPTKADAAAALTLLDGLLDGFPFVDEPSRAVALSTLITPVVRGAMQVAPLHANTAPVAGSGKSFILDVAAAILIGDRAPVISAGRNEEETEKRLGAALLSGMPIVSIDNVNGQLGGDALCQMIERPVVSVRPLGVSKLVRIESRATTFATGNNIQLVGDMTRRVVLCSLDPNMERPELRTFKFNPFQVVLQDRGRFVAAALTIARAYTVAGCPGELAPLASFEDWSRVVRSALVWLGRADPCETMASARDSDPVVTQLSAVLHAWRDAVGGAWKKTSEIKAAAEAVGQNGPIHGDLHQALLEVCERRGGGGIDALRLGKYLTRHAGRIVDGLKIASDHDRHSKQNVWSVAKLDS